MEESEDENEKVQLSRLNIISRYICYSCNCLLIIDESASCLECEVSYCKYCLEKQCVNCMSNKFSPLKSGLQIELSHLLISCKNKNQGCKQMVLYSKLKEHEMTCEHQSFKCKFCGNIILKEFLKKHEENWCTEIPLLCKECGFQAPQSKFFHNCEKINFLKEFKLLNLEKKFTLLDKFIPKKPGETIFEKKDFFNLPNDFENKNKIKDYVLKETTLNILLKLNSKEAFYSKEMLIPQWVLLNSQNSYKYPTTLQDLFSYMLQVLNFSTSYMLNLEDLYSGKLLLEIYLKEDRLKENITKMLKDKKIIEDTFLFFVLFYKYAINKGSYEININISKESKKQLQLDDCLINYKPLIVNDCIYLGIWEVIKITKSCYTLKFLGEIETEYDYLYFNKNITEFGFEHSIKEEDLEVICPYLEKNKSLTKINFSYNEFGSNAFIIILKSIIAKPNITSIDFSNNRLNLRAAKYLCKFLKKNQSVTVFDLSSNFLGIRSADYIKTSLEVNNSLTHINLGTNAFKDYGTKLISDSLISNSTLVKVDLENNDIGDKGAFCISQAIKINSSITELNLSNNSISEKGAECLAEALENNYILTVFNIGYNRIRVKGCQIFNEMLINNNSLCKIYVNNNFSSSYEMKGLDYSLFPALHINKKLCFLDISGNYICDIGAEKLSEDLIKNKTLQGLSVSSIGISDKGIISLLKSLTENIEFNFLNISGNYIIEKKTGEYISNFIKEKKYLTWLDLNDMNLGPREIELISLSLRGHTSIATINLSKNKLGRKGIEFLSSAFMFNQSLTNINFEGTEIDSKCVENLCLFVKNNSSIQELDLSNNKIGQEGAELLCCALKMNHSITYIDFRYNKFNTLAVECFSKFIKQYNPDISIDLNLLEVPVYGEKRYKNVDILI
jgi:Ran GTPase-activating protein (RanGAP) involved in mRNA processing and transport